MDNENNHAPFHYSSSLFFFDSIEIEEEDKKLTLILLRILLHLLYPNPVHFLTYLLFSCLFQSYTRSFFVINGSGSEIFIGLAWHTKVTLKLLISYWQLDGTHSASFIYHPRLPPGASATLLPKILVNPKYIHVLWVSDSCLSSLDPNPALLKSWQRLSLVHDLVEVNPNLI